MTGRLLVCTDLDRTLIANGAQPESAGARARFDALVARPEVVLAYVSGRHRQLVARAIATYRLPGPDFVVADVGTTIYRAGGNSHWRRSDAWEKRISVDWNGKSRFELMEMLTGLPDLRPQERSKQNRYKLSYYLPMQFDAASLEDEIRQRLARLGVVARLIWSIDDPAGVGLLDILPASASKFHALEYLMREQGYGLTDTVFCGDSGNDLEVLTSPIPSVLVANAADEIKALARQQSEMNGHGASLYVARGGLFGMNGNYSAGMLEGIAHFHPGTEAWMKEPGTAGLAGSTGGQS